MLNQVTISRLMFLPGCSAGLGERTALVDVQFTGQMDDPGAMLTAFAAEARHLCPEEPMWGLGHRGWPAAFVQDDANQTTAVFATWVVALTVALQRWARDPVWQGRVLHADEATLRLALPYARPSVLKAAVVLAVRHLLAWSQASRPGAARAVLLKDLRDWLGAVQPGGLAPNTLRFYAAARQRDIPTDHELGALRLGWAARAEVLDSSFTMRTSNIAARTAKNKHQTSQLLRGAGLPVPPLILAASQDQAQAAAQKLGWPVVVKPSNQDQGLGVVPGIRDEAALVAAFDAAANYSPGAVVVEKHIEGEDHRMLVVGGRHVMSTRRIPAGVTGDGQQSLVALVKQANADPLRGVGKRSMLIQLVLDAEAAACLREQGLAPDSIPLPGQFVRLRRTANISTGGTAVDVTGQVHPDNRALAVRAARIVGLDIAGIDFLCPDISRSWREVGGGICEVNAQPGFRVHWLGHPERDINGEVVDWMFAGQTGRIPTAAITGTNGKTTVARMLHHIWMCAGKVAGMSVTSGVWVGHDMVSDLNLSGQPGASMLLRDPAVEVAVIELPRKGLIWLGHPCDRYDVAALLNVQDDHIGVDGIESLQQMAELKAEVLQRASHAIVVGADDALCLAMRQRASTQRHVLVAREATNQAVAAHREAGGEAVYLAQRDGQPWVALARGAAEVLLMPSRDIPATMNGLLRFNESNALFAAAMAWVQGLPLPTIRQALASFHNSPAQNPGRYNFIEGLPFRVLLDYGHNPAGVREVCALVQQLPVAGRRILLSLKLGSRHRRHFDEVAPLLKQTFARFVLGCDPKYAERCADYAGDDPLATMLAMCRQSLLEAGVAVEDMVCQAQPQAALLAALQQARPGDLVVVLAEPWFALPALERWRSSLAR